MAIELISKIKPANNGGFAMVDAADVEMPDGSRLDAAIKNAGGGGSVEVHIFDLAALGMPAIDISGGTAQIEMDTSEIWAALDKGAVTFGVPIVMGPLTATGYCTMHSFTDGASMHQCIGAFYDAEMLYLVVTVLPDLVQAAVMPLAALLPEETPPATIDMSAFESEGKIVEHYADDTSKTTLFEFDADGNPTKITDSAGNVTALAW